MIKQKVEVISATEAYLLAEAINEFNETHNVFATQIFPPRTIDGITWTAFIHYREAKE